MDFGDVIRGLKEGKRFARVGWNGKDMWLVIVGNTSADDIDYIVRDDSDGMPLLNIDLLPWIGLKTADNKFVPWLASQSDMLAEDWIELPEFGDANGTESEGDAESAFE